MAPEPSATVRNAADGEEAHQGARIRPRAKPTHSVALAAAACFGTPTWATHSSGCPEMGPRGCPTKRLAISSPTPATAIAKERRGRVALRPSRHPGSDTRSPRDDGQRSQDSGGFRLRGASGPSFRPIRWVEIEFRCGWPR